MSLWADPYLICSPVICTIFSNYLTYNMLCITNLHDNIWVAVHQKGLVQTKLTLLTVPLKSSSLMNFDNQLLIFQLIGTSRLEYFRNAQNFSKPYRWPAGISCNKQNSTKNILWYVSWWYETNKLSDKKWLNCYRVCRWSSLSLFRQAHLGEGQLWFQTRADGAR